MSAVEYEREKFVIHPTAAQGYTKETHMAFSESKFTLPCLLLCSYVNCVALVHL